jgi:lysophospholipase L1-like esterase
MEIVSSSAHRVRCPLHYIIDKMRFMKFILPAAIIFFYLYISYAGFYNYIRKMNLQRPTIENTLILENPNGNGSVKYVALGDSLSAGVGSENPSETIVYLFGAKLSETNEKVNIVNLAQPGGTTVDVINEQLSLALNEKPDYVTLLIGINDIHNRISAKEFQENYTFILEELLTGSDAQITVINLPYLGLNKVVRPPYSWLLNSRTKLFNKIISDVVASKNQSGRIRLVDLYKNSYEIFKQDPKYYSSDFFHPSGEGYVMWSGIINAN